MADVASLLLEIETAQKENDDETSKSSQFLGSLFDNDEDDDITDLSSSNNNQLSSISLSITGKSCIISKNSHDPNNDLIKIQSVKNETILTDRYDVRHKLSEYDMKEIISTQQRLKSNKNIYAKQWEEDNKWHLRNEKLSLIQENTPCSIDELQFERYRDLNNDNNKNDKKPGTYHAYDTCHHTKIMQLLFIHLFY